MNRDQTLEAKHHRLLLQLKSFDDLAVAFSGGVDSSLLLVVAKDVLRTRVTAFTARSATHPRSETLRAVELAAALGVRHEQFDSGEMESPDFIANGPQRCYYCKKKLFTGMAVAASKMGLRNLAHGANIDDLSDFRPGFRAAQELSVFAPLVEAGLAKSDVRRLARQLGLTNWNQPAMACLATRIPYGTAIDQRRLEQVEHAEAILTGIGIQQVRVRHHGNLARIEVADPADMDRLHDPGLRREIVGRFMGLGFSYVCLDLEGYLSGKMNRAIDATEATRTS